MFPGNGSAGQVLTALGGGATPTFQSIAAPGVAVDLTSLLWQGRMSFIRMSQGTVTNIGLTHILVSGTLASKTWANTNLYTSWDACSFITSAVAGNSSGSRAVANAMRGASAGLGGFTYRCRFGGMVTVVANMRSFVGLYGTAGAIGNVNPSTLLDQVGLQFDSGETVWSIGSNDAAGTATRTSLGANFPSTNSQTDIYDLLLYAAPNDTKIHYEVTRLNTGDFASGDLSSDLPTNNVALHPQIWVNNGTTAAACAIGCSGYSIITPV